MSLNSSSFEIIQYKFYYFISAAWAKAFSCDLFDVYLWNIIQL